MNDNLKLFYYVHMQLKEYPYLAYDMYLHTRAQMVDVVSCLQALTMRYSLIFQYVCTLARKLFN